MLLMANLAERLRRKQPVFPLRRLGDRRLWVVLAVHRYLVDESLLRGTQHLSEPVRAQVLQNREINEPGGGVLVRLVRIIARFWVVRVFARSELLSLVDPDKGATRCFCGPRQRYLIYSIKPTGVPDHP